MNVEGIPGWAKRSSHVMGLESFEPTAPLPPVTESDGLLDGGRGRTR